MWEEVLNLERVGINDDFFELGGHSLLALQFLPRLRNRFQVELTPRDFFASSTVAAVALVVEEKLIAEIEQMGEAEIAEAGE
jgi:acyl carrier protein